MYKTSILAPQSLENRLMICKCLSFNPALKGKDDQIRSIVQLEIGIPISDDKLKHFYMGTNIGESMGTKNGYPMSWFIK